MGSRGQVLSADDLLLLLVFDRKSNPSRFNENGRGILKSDAGVVAEKSQSMG